MPSVGDGRPWGGRYMLTPQQPWDMWGIWDLMPALKIG